MKTFGLIGKTLKHSFSQKYFTEKFQTENIEGCQYKLFELASSADFENLLKDNKLNGLNVTIPYKEDVVPYMANLDDSARRIGAVNVVKFEKDGTLTGYNSDYYGFKKSLLQLLEGVKPTKGLILGTGGASKAVRVALEDIGVVPTFVSRTKKEGQLSYDELTEESIKDYQVIVNCTPLGTYPNPDEAPAIPFGGLDERHFLFDLVYNPAVSLFLQKGLDAGGKIKNGLDMLHLQAEKSWEIWNE